MIDTFTFASLKRDQFQLRLSPATHSLTALASQWPTPDVDWYGFQHNSQNFQNPVVCNCKACLGNPAGARQQPVIIHKATSASQARPSDPSYYMLCAKDLPAFLLNERRWGMILFLLAYRELALIWRQISSMLTIYNI